MNQLPRHDNALRSDSGRPVGILAAVLALAIAVLAGVVGQTYALGLATRYAHAVADQQLPMKWESLTLQRAALANGSLLPMYGSSELYCCGDPLRGTQFFATRPTGFDLFSVGRAGTADLFFFETFAALGGSLQGKKLIVSVSPPWFESRSGIDAKPYAGNFSPEIATAFVFDAPISLDLKEAGARPFDLRDSRRARPPWRDIAPGATPRAIAGILQTRVIAETAAELGRVAG